MTGASGASPAQYVTTTTAGPVRVTAGSSALLTAEEREFYAMRWRVLMLELRFIADRMGWADRLPSKRI